MTLRHAVLPVGAVLLLGIGVYLFHEVRSQPATAQIDPSVRAARRAPEPPPPPTHVESAAPPAAHLDKPPVVMPTAAQQIRQEPPAVPENHEVRFSPDSGDNPKDAQKLQAVMDEANKAYDHGDTDEAKTIAQKVLAKDPTNVRMLRIMVSASCIDGDTPLAQANFSKLPAADQQQMRVRCARYGVTFEGGNAAP